MKRFFLFATLSVATLTVVSCSKSNDDEPDPNPSQKLITKIATASNYGYEFTYDSQNRIKSYLWFDHEHRTSYTLEYFDGYFNIKNDRGLVYKCVLNANGQVTKIEEDGNATFTYNSQNQLTSFTNLGYTYNFTWAQGNPINISQSGERYTYSFDSSLKNKANLDINWFNIQLNGNDNDLGILGFLGKTTNLVKGTDEGGTYIYEFDSDGYVTKITYDFDNETRNDPTYITYK